MGSRPALYITKRVHSPRSRKWFFPGTPASSTTKTGRHDIAEILLNVALNTKNKSINQSTQNDLQHV
jgi:hypothetical protein